MLQPQRLSDLLSQRSCLCLRRSRRTRNTDALHVDLHAIDDASTREAPSGMRTLNSIFVIAAIVDTKPKGFCKSISELL